MGAIALAVAACDAAEEVEAAPADLTAIPPSPPAQRLDLGDGLYEPLAGDPEREALLGLVKRNVEDQIGLPVEFLVETLRVKDDWAYGALEPVRIGGDAIAMKDTRLKDTQKALNGLRTEVIWRKTGEDWTLGQYAVGADDAWYEPYCGVAPAGVIPVCGADAAKP